MNISDCLEAERVHINARFISTQAIVIFFDITGILLCLYVTVLIAISQVLHINLRILLINLSALLCLRSALTLNRSVYNVIDAITYTNSCSLLKTYEACKTYSTITAAPYESLVFSFIAIAIERCIATIAYKHYERWRVPFVALLLGPVTWINITLIIRKMIGGVKPIQIIYKPYCSSLTAGYVNFTKLFNYNIPLIVVSFLLFIAVHFICKRRLRLFLASKVDDLSSRYQLVENAKSTKILAILSSVYTILVLFNLCSLIVMVNRNMKDLAEFAVIKEITSFSMPIYINFHSIIFLLQSTHIRSRAARMFHHRTINKRKFGTTVGPVLSAKQHMDILEKMWSTANK